MKKLVLTAAIALVVGVGFGIGGMAICEKPTPQPITHNRTEDLRRRGLVLELQRDMIYDALQKSNPALAATMRVQCDNYAVGCGFSDLRIED